MPSAEQWEKNILTREQAMEAGKEIKGKISNEIAKAQKDIEDYTTRVTSSQDASHEDITKAINTGREALDMIAEAKSKAMRELDKIMTETEERMASNELQINP